MGGPKSKCISLAILEVKKSVSNFPRILSSHAAAYVQGKIQCVHSRLDLPKACITAPVGDGLDFSVNKLSVKSPSMKSVSSKIRHVGAHIEKLVMQALCTMVTFTPKDKGSKMMLL